METPIGAWRISIPTPKDNLKAVSQRKKCKQARHQKNDIPPKKIDVLQINLQKQQEKIDSTPEKIDIPQEKIDELLKKNDRQLEKNIKSHEKIDKTLEKSVEQQKNNQKPIRKREKEYDKDTPCCEFCSCVKSNISGTDQPGLKGGKTPSVVIPSVSSISQSINKNCRHCCFALGELFKEICKKINGETNSRVGVILNEISDILLALANDCVLFLRKIGISTTSCLSKGARPMQEYVTSRVKRTQKCASDKVTAVKDTSLQYAKIVSEGVATTLDKTKQYAENACNGVAATLDKTKQCAENACNAVTSTIDKTKQCAENACNGVVATIDKTKQCAENACNSVTAIIDKTKQTPRKPKT